MKCFIFKPFFIILFLASFISPVLADSIAKLSADIQGGKWKSVRLRDLPKDTVLAVKVESNGEMVVSFLDYRNYQSFSKTSRPLFQGIVKKRLSFSIVIPSKGDYFIVLDNRSGKEPRIVGLMVIAAKGSVDRIKSAEEDLRRFESQLHQIFIFDPFPIGIKQCGSPKAFVDESGIFLCTEYVHHLYEILKDFGRTKDVLSFSIFHEAARILLTKWDHPSSDIEEMADELATVLMVMFNQEERVIDIGEYLVKNPSICESMEKIFQDERHPLSFDRAQNLLNLMRDPNNLALKWQNFLVPHMQTILLRILKIKPTPWTNLPLVEKELLKRSSKNKTPV